MRRDKFGKLRSGCVDRYYLHVSC